jgi:Abortive infection alpha
MSGSGDDYKTEVVRQVGELAKDAYGDLLAPMSKELGESLGTLGRTINAALAPLRGVVWSFEQIETYVVSKVGEILQRRGVSPERIQPPDIDVAVPAIEALRYSKLKQGYASLLATAMDREAASDVHPAFVEILRQIAPDEARILNFLPRLGLYEPIVDLVYTLPQAGTFTIRQHVGTLGNDAGCDNVELLPRYVDNLCRLGIAEVPSRGGLYEEWRYDKIKNLALVEQVESEIPSGGEFGIVKKMFGVTTLGDAFRRACRNGP